MLIKVRLFAVLRQLAGSQVTEVELADRATVADLLEQLGMHRELGQAVQQMPLVVAVNREYATDDQIINEGDEIALVPPVSGGSTVGAVRYVCISQRPLRPDALVEIVSDARAGAVVVFQGVTREVDALHYEAYVEMAEEKIAEIAAQVAERNQLVAVAVEHRIGQVELRQPSVVVAVSAAHREEVFAGARELIDRIKAEAPIWKVEIDQSGQRWVEGRPPSTPKGLSQ